VATSLFKPFPDALRVGLGALAVLFGIEAADVMLPLRLADHGIVPRTVYGLQGILFSPLLHANFAHLAANAIPLAVLLTLLFWDRRYRPGYSLALVWLGSGFGTWLIGRSHDGPYPIVHIGASGVIFGLVAYLVAAGIWMNSWRAAIIAVVVLISFGGIFYGVLPQGGAISWEGHLSGAVAGVWAARSAHA
jgi:membrane associated rhomboid family serine protease